MFYYRGEMGNLWNLVIRTNEIISEEQKNITDYCVLIYSIAFVVFCLLSAFFLLFSDPAVDHIYPDFHAVFHNYLPSMESVWNICTGGKTWIQQAGLFNIYYLKLSVLHYWIFIGLFFLKVRFAILLPFSIKSREQKHQTPNF